MTQVNAREELSAALAATADRLEAALILLAVQTDGKWWVAASSSPLLTDWPDPVALWGGSTASSDDGRAPAIVCEILGRPPAQRWLSCAAESPDMRLAVYWTEERHAPIADLTAAWNGLALLAKPAALPPVGAFEPVILAQIIESLPVALILFDCAGMSVAANRFARDLLDLRPFDVTPRAVARKLEALGVREAVPADLSLRHAAGPLRIGDRLYAASARAAQGDWGAGVVWRIEDVTQARLAEAKLEEARRALLLAEVSGGVGHEFNNLLSRVMAVAEDIQDEAPSSRIHDLAETLIETAERGAHVVRRLMTYAGSVPPDLRPVELISLMTSWGAEQPGNALHLDVAGCTVDVLVDPLLLRSSLSELLKNARQANAREIRVGCTRAADGIMVAVSVEDDGIGMDAATLARATQPFFTNRPVGEGVGLGLSMVKGALDQWGGGSKSPQTLGREQRFGCFCPRWRL